MGQAREQRIRERAYAIWEREGRPDERHLLHWQLACEDIKREEVGLRWQESSLRRVLSAPPKGASLTLDSGEI